MTTKTEYGWLIERCDCKGEPLADWYAGTGQGDPQSYVGYNSNWTRDASKAIRFARQQDAEQFMKGNFWVAVKATEHAW